MRAVSTLIAIGAALWLAAPAAQAVGFGRVTNATQLGQTLNFAAALRLDADETLARECVSAEVQSGENRLPAPQVRATLEGDSTERSVRVTTTAIIDEPVVTVVITVGCDSKISRRFVAFVDPPPINLAQAAPSTLPPQRQDSQVAPIVTIVQGDNAPPAPRPAASAPAQRKPRPASAPRIVPRPDNGDRPPVPSVANASPRAPRAPLPAPPSVPASGGPRLRLDTAPAVVARSGPVAASSAASSAIAIAAAEAAALASAEAASAISRAKEQADLLAKERERIQQLEDGLTKVRAESRANQQALLALQSRLKQAESERYTNPLVYGLAWLSALLALGVAGLLWRQSRGRGSQWWSGPMPAPVESAPAAPAAMPIRVPVERHSAYGALAPAPPVLDDDPVTGAGAFAIPTVIEDDDTAVTRVPVTQPAPLTPISLAPPVLNSTEPPRELSVEELIDLEQQAEFFIVLGQDDAAIELLMSHVRSDGGISPLPYLKLLEIYRRRGENEAYERIRDRFNRRFNAYAPEWDADLQQGRSLADYPETIVSLQSMWASPSRVMETLDASLFRRNRSDATFDLPAYRELLFLYSIARDLAEHGAAAPASDVDLLLPLSDEPHAEPIARLSATPADSGFQHSEMQTLPVDLDVTLQSNTRPPRSGESGFIDFDLNQPFTTDPPAEPKS